MKKILQVSRMNDHFIQAAWEDRRTYNCSLGLANSFLSDLEYKRFALWLWFWGNCNTEMDAINQHCCEHPNPLRCCGCRADEKICDKCGSDGYAGRWCLENSTDDYVKDLIHQRCWLPYTCHQALEET